MSLIDINNYTPEIHTLPIAGEHIKSGAVVTVDENGRVWNCDRGKSPQGVIFEDFTEGESVKVMVRNIPGMPMLIMVLDEGENENT